MAEITGKDHIDQTTDFTTESPSCNISLDGETKPINLNKEPELMEVHKHPHHVTHKKKWGEYLLEFFMLFLAVFLGFLAENYRETLVNEEKEKHYMQNLLGDLRADTTALNRAINYNGVLMRMLDSAIQIAPERLTDISVQDTFFHYTFLYYSFIPTFTASTNTISQLKAGGFNILHSDKTKDLINSLYNFYDNNVNFDTKHAEGQFWDIAHKMQSMMRLPRSAYSWTDPAAYIIPVNRRIFLTTDPVSIAQLYNLLGGASGSLDGNRRTQMDAVTKATELMDYLKEEYKLP